MILFEEVSKIYNQAFYAVKNLSFGVKDGEVLVLLGTSGSGKTTTMKMVNRLIEPSAGRITINGQDITKRDPVELRLEIGYAIQQVGLFPHMTIEENINVVPCLLNWDEQKRKESVVELLNMVRLDPAEFRYRYPGQLSGGQQQRVGVARALAGDPPIILMDEPFGALDPLTRNELQKEFRRLQERLHKTVIFVTHDIFEAFELGDRIAVLEQGQLAQIGTPDELTNAPASDFVARFIGSAKEKISLFQ
jgi:osmoprotectant transport system ATP-binding protein